MSIHQPRYSIFKFFDTLTLLSGGDLVYHGPTTHCVDYFGRIGKPNNSGMDLVFVYIYTLFTMSSWSWSAPFTLQLQFKKDFLLMCHAVSIPLPMVITGSRFRS